MQQIEVPVLVVGGGPVGMMGSMLLAQHGLETLAVERRSTSQRSPAAHVVNARTFEICRAAGIDMEAVRAAATAPADSGFSIFVTRLAGEEIGRLPFERQGDECLRFTPTPLRNLSQHHFEPILFEALRKTPGAEIRYGHQWESAEQDIGGVTSRIRDLSTDTLYEVRSRYLIGADGAASRVRKLLGIEMIGPPKIQSFLMIHIDANFRSLVASRPGVLYWLLDPEVGHIGQTFVAHDIDREWVYMYGFDSDRESEEDYPEERCRSLVEQALGSTEVPFEIRDRKTWTMSSQVAERIRDGRIFLSGDAAHRFPPTGGLGLNSGVQDVHGLAWKLAAVEQGWASKELLDTYESERLPVARNNAEQSLRNASKLFAIPQSLGVVDDPTTARMQATLDDPVGRRRVEDAIAEQAEHFDMLGLQIGYAYERGALVPDGSAPPTVENPVRDYVPSSRPGARLPHAWLEHAGARISSLDLVERRGFTLFSAAASAGWDAAVASIAPGTASSVASVPLHHVSIGAEIRDVDGHWAEVAGIERGGALLVRPDQHVAWRARTQPDDPTAALSGALRQILQPMDAR